MELICYVEMKPTGSTFYFLADEINVGGFRTEICTIKLPSLVMWWQHGTHLFHLVYQAFVIDCFTQSPVIWQILMTPAENVINLFLEHCNTFHVVLFHGITTFVLSLQGNIFFNMRLWHLIFVFQHSTLHSRQSFLLCWSWGGLNVTAWPLVCHPLLKCEPFSCFDDWWDENERGITHKNTSPTKNRNKTPP